MKKTRPYNRYRIAQVESVETRKINGNGYVQELLLKIEDYNGNHKNPYLLGDVEVNYQEHIVTFKKYRKITELATLEKIDESTINFKSDYELKQLYGLDPKNNHPLIIAYRASKQIRLLEIVYKEKKDYLDRTYVRKHFVELGRDIDFVKKVLTCKKIVSSSRNSIDDFDYLSALYTSLKHNNPAVVSVVPMGRFYNSFVNEGGKFNYLNFRLLAILVKEHEEKLQKEMEKLREEELEEPKEEQVFGQMMMQEYADAILRDVYEELQMATFEGTLDEVYQKRLIKAHKTTK